MKDRIEIRKDLIVVGAGMSGICTALQAARLGLSVGLIEASGYLGGNAGAEVRVNINGADGTSEFNLYARTGGILDEIILENLYRNPQGNAFHFEALLEDVIAREPNIELFLNTAADGVETEEKDGSIRILAVKASQWKEEKKYSFRGFLFVDNTGNGSLGAMAGARFMQGREAAKTFEEKLAPEQADDFVLLGTLIYRAVDTGRPVQYIPPDFACNLKETGALSYRQIPKDSFATSRWFYETGGGIDPSEDSRLLQKHRELVYGIWDYVKNSGNYPAENYDLEYVSCTVGKRENRRFYGGYVLNEQDLTERHSFEDCIGFGGWSIDLHAVHGFFDQDLPNRHFYLPGIYQIPYRCCYSANVKNLFIGGRCASFTHVAHGSARVMGTLCTMGQAAGAAAFLCQERKKFPDQISSAELRQLLLREGAWIPGARRDGDLAASARITASSVLEDKNDRNLSMHPLEKDTALLLPVADRLEYLRLYVQAAEKTSLEIRICCSRHREGYDPEQELGRSQVILEPSTQPEWKELNLAFETQERFVWIWLKANQAVQLGWSQKNPTVALTLCREPNREANIWDACTGMPKEFVWNLSPFCLGYQAGQKEELYGPEQTVNGWGRPEGLANCWRSRTAEIPQKLRFEWEEEKRIKKGEIRFSAEFNRRIYSHLDRNDCRILPEIIRDYDVFAETEGERRCIAQVRGNYKRQNKIVFPESPVKALEFVFLQTNGAEYFSVDEVLLEEEI